ncbi:MAG: LysM peptidoglycan-binding domain-containing protein [Lepagella sp.]
MNRKLITIAAAAIMALVPALEINADKAKTVLDLKSDITDSDIIYPESYEVDTQKMLEGWYLKNYTATDDRYKTQSDVEASDEVIRERLSRLNTVIEMPFNQIVKSYIERYTKRGRSTVPVLLGLSIYYTPIFEQALEENGLPLELKYLPVIESALNPNAVSKHGASGLWQFTLAAGRGLDMEISSLVDERRDPYVSSAKAAQFLKDLYNTYGDWSLAIAAYNCGPGTVNKALRRAGGDQASHDFWSIYNYLPAETRGYVPMFIAANYVMNYYPYHNISPVLATKPLITDTLMISRRVHFNQISKVLNIPLDELRVLNPQFRADIIPGNSEHAYTLVLPSQQIQAYIMSEDEILGYEAELYAQRTDAVPGDQPADGDVAMVEEPSIYDDVPATDDTPIETTPATSSPTVRKASSGATKTVSHKVEPGETLASIATKYNVTVADIKGWNNLTRNSVRTGQMLRITTSREIADASGAKAVAPSKQETYASQSSTAQSPKKKKTDTTSASSKKKDKKGKKQEKKAATTHSVKSGENLSTIAKKYGTTVSELKKANGLKGDELHPGDKLKLPSKGKSTSKKSSKSKSGSKSKKKKKK